MKKALQSIPRSHPLKPFLIMRSSYVIKSFVMSSAQRPYTTLFSRSRTNTIRSVGQTDNMVCVPRRFNSISASTDGSDIPESVKCLTLEDYHDAANETLDLIASDLDIFFEDNNLMSSDVEENSGILSINTTEGSYIINKQPPNKQIWLSSPISGPKRFDLLDKEWVCLRDNTKLFDILQSEIKETFPDHDFEFSQEF